MRKYCILQDRIWNKDLNCKPKYNGESSKCLREIIYNRYFLYMSDKACMGIFKGSIF